ncbi:hypothetical protein AMTRI_Chr07g23220 [Amborella trichopoda]
MSRLGSANVGSTWLTSARLANIGSLRLTSNLWVEREILEKKQFIRCLRMSSHVNLPQESQDLLRFETQDLDDQVLHAHIQNGYIYLQMSKHGVAPFRVRWKVIKKLISHFNHT